MLKKLKKSDSRGFTIIEVMIVLAIAALILLIVFLAVPALQRSSRNTQRKNDASNLESAISNAVSDQGGGNLTSGMLTEAINNTKFGYYTTGASVIFYNQPSVTPGSLKASSTTPAANTVTTEDINVYAGMACDPSNPNNPPSASGASARNFAVVYAVETGSGNGEYECQSQ